MHDAITKLSDDPAERRGHMRVDRVHKLFLQVVGHGDGHGDGDGDAPAGPTPLVRCACDNVSPTGIGITMLDGLDPGVRVELWVNVQDHDARFLLGGVVRWCRTATYRGLFEVGLELEPGPTYELERWAALWQPSGASAER